MTEESGENMKNEEIINSENENEKSTSDKWKERFFNIIWIVAIFLVAILIVEFVGQRTKVDGRSMEPTLQDGDQLIVDKISYRFRDNIVFLHDRYTIHYHRKDQCPVYNE